MDASPAAAGAMARGAGLDAQVATDGSAMPYMLSFDTGACAFLSRAE